MVYVPLSKRSEKSEKVLKQSVTALIIMCIHMNSQLFLGKIKDVVLVARCQNLVFIIIKLTNHFVM